MRDLEDAIYSQVTTKVRKDNYFIINEIKDDYARYLAGAVLQIKSKKPDKASMKLQRRSVMMDKEDRDLYEKVCNLGWTIFSDFSQIIQAKIVREKRERLERESRALLIRQKVEQQMRSGQSASSTPTTPVVVPTPIELIKPKPDPFHNFNPTPAVTTQIKHKELEDIITGKLTKGTKSHTGDFELEKKNLRGSLDSEGSFSAPTSPLVFPAKGSLLELSPRGHNRRASTGIGSHKLLEDGSDDEEAEDVFVPCSLGEIPIKVNNFCGRYFGITSLLVSSFWFKNVVPFAHFGNE